ncbi:MAG: glycoside hydrolase domain-containing protein [Victivallales bacterium]
MRIIDRKKTFVILCAMITAFCSISGDETNLPPQDAAAFPWLGNDLGKEHVVPAPWTAVEVKGQEIAVWGRKIVYGNSLFPIRISSQDVELLASPVRLEIIKGGQPLVFGNVKWQIVSKRDDQVVLKTTALAAGLDCTVTTTIEFDGMIKINMILSPEKEMDIDGCRILIPLTREAAKICSRYLEYDFVTMEADKTSLMECMKPVGEQPIHFAFIPEVSLSNRKVGLAWAAETDQRWDKGSPAKSLSVLPGEKSVDLVMNVLSKNMTLTSPRTLEFALFPFPLKPQNLKMRQVRIGAESRLSAAVDAGGNRDIYDYYAILMPKEFDAKWDSLPEPAGTVTTKNCRERLRDKGFKFIPYGALWYSNAFHPAARAFSRQWSIGPVSANVLKRWERYNEGVKEDLSKKGGGHWDGYRVRADAESYADFVVWTYLKSVKDDGIDGIYFDHGEVPMSSVAPPAHSTADKGMQAHFGMFGHRELLKRLWVSAKKIKPDLVICLHQSHTAVSLNSFADIVITGEIMNGIFRQWRPKPEINRNQAAYRPDYDLVPEALMTYDSLDSRGFESRLLPQIKFTLQKYWDEHPSEYERFSEKMYRRTLLNGIRHYDAFMHQPSIDKAWRVMDKIGRLDGSVGFHPWWEAGARFKAAGKSTRLSYYSRDKRVLLIIGNESREDVQEQVRTAMPGQRIKAAADASDSGDVSLKDGAINLVIPAGLYRAVILDME